MGDFGLRVRQSGELRPKWYIYLLSCYAWHYGRDSKIQDTRSLMTARSQRKQYRIFLYGKGIPRCIFKSHLNCEARLLTFCMFNDWL